MLQIACAGNDFVLFTSKEPADDSQFYTHKPGVFMSMGGNAQGQLGDGSGKNQWVPQLINKDAPEFTSVRTAAELNWKQVADADVIASSFVARKHSNRRSYRVSSGTRSSRPRGRKSPLRGCCCEVRTELSEINQRQGLTSLFASDSTKGAWTWGFGEYGASCHLG